ncbi:BolA family protein [Enterovirga sp. CN4-39]|uniref:BolA family protein n=1 Tax=Enterovirga sp. CN4-39 TaxID=3400910 RepID=UPI003C0143DC
MIVSLRERMAEIVTRELRPTELRIDDESHLHAGHAGSREGGETHFRIDVVSEAFIGKSRVERHRMVNELMTDAFGRDGLHALAIRARAPGE